MNHAQTPPRGETEACQILGMELTDAELDFLIVSLELRDRAIRDEQRKGAQLPEQIAAAVLDELAELRAKLVAELDARPGRQG